MRAALTALLRVPVGIFYRRWSLGEPIPARGPLILVANHPNGLIDPVVVATLTRRPVRFLAKEPLFRMPVVGAIVRSLGSLPVFRVQDGADTAQNERTFDAVFEALHAGDVVCLFPEGTSHSEPGLQKLKTGAARMALGAEARRGFEAGVRIVPLGLVYGDKGRFRSKLATCVGEPIEVADLARSYADDPRAATLELTARIEAGLRTVTLNLDRWEDLPLLELVERIWRPEAPEDQHGGQREGRPKGQRGRRVDRLRLLADGVHQLRSREPERLARLEAEVEAFARLLGRLGVSPDELRIVYTPRGVARFVLRRGVELGVALPLALVGVLVWGPAWLLTGAVAAVLRPASDLIATVKLLAALLVFPLWWSACGIAAFTLGGPWAAAAWVVGAPLLGRLTLALIGRHVALADDVGAFLRFASRSALKRKLLTRRDALAAEIDAFAAAYAVERPR